MRIFTLTLLVSALPWTGCGRIHFDQLSNRIGSDGDSGVLVSAVQPSSGLGLGGQILTIIGKGFSSIPDSTTIGVTLGNVACTNVTVVSDSELRCISGTQSTVSAVPAQISVAGTIVASLEAAFVYLGAPFFWLRPEALSMPADAQTIDMWSSAAGTLNAKQTQTSNQPRWSAQNQALTFDGDDWLGVMADTSLRPKRLTIAARYRPTSIGGWDKLVCMDYHNDGSWSDPYVSYNLSASEDITGAPYFEVTCAGVGHKLLSNTPLPLNQTHVAIGAYDGTNITLRLNQNIMVSEPQSGDIDYPTNANLAIGNRSTTTPFEYFNGVIHEVLMWPVALTPIEQEVVYNYLNNRP